MRSWVETKIIENPTGMNYRRPLREVVSWNDEDFAKKLVDSGRPLREVVSWNIKVWEGNYNTWVVDLFVRSWVETYHCTTLYTYTTVNLFVRSWVETFCNCIISLSLLSTSSWGRELKPYHIINDRFRVSVDLFVRSWVETPLISAYVAL